MPRSSHSAASHRLLDASSGLCSRSAAWQSVSGQGERKITTTLGRCALHAKEYTDEFRFAIGEKPFFAGEQPECVDVSFYATFVTWEPVPCAQGQRRWPYQSAWTPISSEHTPFASEAPQRSLRQVQILQSLASRCTTSHVARRESTASRL